MPYSNLIPFLKSFTVFQGRIFQPRSSPPARSCRSQWLSSPGLGGLICTIGLLISTSAQAAGLYITEIMHSPGSQWGDDYTWFELYNHNPNPVDISGYVYQVTWGGRDFRRVVPEGSWIQPYSAAVLTGDITVSPYWHNFLPVGEVWDPTGSRGLNFIYADCAIDEDLPDHCGGRMFQNARLSVWESLAVYGETGAYADAILDISYFDARFAPAWPTYAPMHSIYLTDLEADPNQGSSWALSIAGEAGAFAVPSWHQQAGDYFDDRSDIGSPGFVPFAPVPEPLTILGTLAALGFGVRAKRYLER